VGADDTVACWAMETVMRMGLHVPDEVAIVGITNDEFDCITAPVALSSVDLNASALGDQATRLLLRLIAGRPAPAKPILVRPAGVITRASSDMLATDDPIIARVVRHARDRLSSGIQIAVHLCSWVAISGKTGTRASRLCPRQGRRGPPPFRAFRVFRSCPSRKRSLPVSTALQVLD
jgi:LacI family transcriptional regulator